MQNQWMMFVVLGLAAGLLSGCCGVGSGIVMVPALVLLLGFPQKSAQGLSLAVMVPMALVGAIRYVAAPDIKVDLRIAALIALAAIPASLCGCQLAILLPGSVLRRLFAVFMIVAAVRMLVCTPRKPQGEEKRPGTEVIESVSTDTSGDSVSTHRPQQP